ncbi:hypothetical protein NtRootA9_10730 [Arthrobacter sp. NtRootA9]|nr:hypothetical protein NtRootA9_10730 [Arthrobacter sp. NtRootA9]
MDTVDSNSPEDFAGIEYTIFVSAPQVYNSHILEGKVSSVVENFFVEHAMPVRRHFVGGFGSTTGAPPFLEFLLWVQEHWESLEKMATLLAGFAAGVAIRWRRLEERINNRILNPYCPSIIIDVAVRTSSEALVAEGSGDRSYYSLLRLLPNLDAALREELNEHKVSIQAIDSTTSSPRFALFNVKSITTSDVTLMIRYLRRLKEGSEVNAVMLYRALGFYRRLVPSRGASQFMRLLLRSMSNN